MTSPQPTRRTGLGRRVADIVQAEEADGDPGRLLGGGPEVIPFEVVPFAMLIADSSGQVRAVNQRWLAWSGMTVEASLGSGWLASAYPQDRPSLQAAVEKVARTGIPLRRHCPSPGPAERHVEWWVSAHEQAGERLIGIAVHPGSASEGLRGEALTGEPLRAEPPQAPQAAHGAPRGGPAEAVVRPLRGVAPAGPTTQPALADDPVLRELPGLLLSVDALIATLERLIERLPQPELLPA